MALGFSFWVLAGCGCGRYGCTCGRLRPLTLPPFACIGLPLCPLVRHVGMKCRLAVPRQARTLEALILLFLDLGGTTSALFSNASLDWQTRLSAQLDRG